MTKKTKKHHVVIIGGGFGGFYATRCLRKIDVDITLIDKRNFHLFQPLLYQVATGALSPADIASPLRGVLAKQSNVTVKLDEMIGVDYENQVVLTREDNIGYDSLIVATGSENFYFGRDTWRDNAPGLKTIEDALNIRNRVFTAFEQAEKTQNEDERKRLMTFVLIGGGPTGVELAGALGEITRINLRDNFRTINPSDAQIIILEGGNCILRPYSEKLQKAATRSLASLGVEVRTGVYAENIDESGVTVKEGDKTYRIPAKTVIWAAGIKASTIGKLLVKDENHITRTGQIKVNHDLSLPGQNNVFVIGDLAYVTDKTGKQLPGTAPVAISEGRYVAHLIENKIKNKAIEPYYYKDKGNLAVIGRAAAIADFGWAQFSGYPAWLLWLFVHLLYIVEYDNRLLIFIQWAWNYFSRNRGARLITYDKYK